MECCSSDCSKAGALPANQEIDETAAQLANLLAQTDEYLEFVRFAQLIHLDPDVKQLLSQIRGQQMAGGQAGDLIVEDLKAQLEALPAVQAYRKAEKAAQDLFREVDRMISANAGFQFAPNALRSGCG